MKSRYFYYFLLWMTVVFGMAAPGCAQESVKAAAARDRSAAAATEYRIGPADVLQISVWKNEALSQTVPVRSDGMISLPLVNEVQAAGMTPLQLRDTLKRKFEEYIPKPEVSVIIVEMNSFTVSILGEVRTAGRYQFASRVTVLDVLAQAGGITEFASPDDIFILRQEGNNMVKIPFNYDRVIATSAKQQNVFVRPGDIVVVP
ncbi:MAG TPA: polysaccharide biosynthesis/export family protein [Gammaproteobacteria bacterium]